MKINSFRNFFSTLFFILLLCIIGNNAQCQKPMLPIDSISGKITYTEVVFLDSSAKKEVLFSRGQDWFSKAFKSYKHVIQIEDKDLGKIYGKSIVTVYVKYMGVESPNNINYAIRLFFRDGRYKYEITDFITTESLPCEEMINNKTKYPMVSMEKTQQWFDSELTQMDNYIKALIEDLKKYMTLDTNDSTGSDW